jgi:glucosamine kinase
LSTNFSTLIGVDGGGTGTRVRVVGVDGSEIGCANSGASSLAYGTQAAWTAILEAIRLAHQNAGIQQPPLNSMAIGLGLAGAHNLHWAEDFKQSNPGFAHLAMASDGMTTLLGAHLGMAGAIIAVGTGIIGEVLTLTGEHREVSGWGFPAGDDGSGAWIGLRAINYAQRMLDGRSKPNAFAQAVSDFCGQGRVGMFDWLAKANQGDYARLAPIVLEHAADNAQAHGILLQAGAEIDVIARTLDPHQHLPIALCGGLGMRLKSYLPIAFQERVIAAKSDATHGALHLLRQQIADHGLV